ncbi:MAG: hypothetical protein K1X79_05235 [Oligoflexia bacterium]|nr:hypothetical protein [Oligoflexia bacterium]
MPMHSLSTPSLNKKSIRFTRSLVRVVLLSAFCMLTACSSQLGLQPVPADSGQMITDSTLYSRGFHQVALQTRLDHFDLGPLVTARFSIKNGSALDTALDIRNFSASLNGQPIALQSYDKVHERVLAEHDAARQDILERQSRLALGYEHVYGVDSYADMTLANDWDPVGYSLESRMLASQTERRLKALEEQTQRRLANLDALYVRGVHIPADGVYTTLLEVPVPVELKAGDELELTLNLAPDAHNFHVQVKERD